MRLSDREIHTEIESGNLVVVGPRKDFPFDKYKQVQPCSIDLRLDNLFHRFKEDVRQFDIKDLDHVWDYMSTLQIGDGEPIVINPGEILFGQIYEQLKIPADTSGKIVGRSRFARLGLSIHATGDFINPEFEGAMPLQIINHNKIRIVIYPHINICQLITLHI
jgi:dCTP deaminase